MALPKKYNITESEKKWQDLWEKEKIFKYNSKSKKPVYSVDTPPPTVSSVHLHAGHAMSYSQAEFIVRYKRMKGYEVFYPMGFDDNGLPTERYVEQKHKIDKSKITRKKFIELCLEETKSGGKDYEALWRRMALSVDWSLLYSTIGPLAQRVSQRSFIYLYKEQLVERKQGPVLWCPQCQTAISQADLEDSERETQLVHIKAKVEDGKEIVFATTRPELLPSCAGISVNSKDKRYKDLVGKKIIMPITGAKIEMTTDEMVDPEFGTGIVYFCSSGDRQFLEWEVRHPVKDKIYLLDPDGTMNEKAGAYKGLSVYKTREKIIEDLKKLDVIDKIDKIKHVVNIHERCGSDVEYVHSKQWFIKLDQKEDFLKRGEAINWYPEFMKKRYEDWVNNLQWDWCISRQRYYGVPFPVWYCKDCDEIILPKENELPVDPTEQEKKCPKCKKLATGEEDVMDTWMTSSMTPLINAHWQEKDENMKIYPMSLRVQAFEIIRTWLFYTVVKSHYHTGSLPWENVMISGHGLDEKGEKISKSKGNFIDVNEIIDDYGADALRYWASGVTLGNNIRFQEAELKNGKRLLTKLWNVAKFSLPHLENYKLKENESLREVDKWILHRLQKTISEATKHFEEYEYAKTMEAVYKFFWHDLADNYLEFVKYRLYNQEEVGEESYQAAQYTLYVCLRDVLKLFAPILPHVTEGVWQAYFKESEKDASIHISSWPVENKKYVNQKIEETGGLGIEILTAVREHKTKKALAMNAELEKFDYKLSQNKIKAIGPWLEDLKKVSGVKEFKFK